MTFKAMRVQHLTVGQLDVNCYLVSCDRTAETIIIDPGDEAERIIEYIGEERLRPAVIVLTHAHYDHVCAAGDLKAAFGIPIAMHDQDLPVYGSTRTLCVSWGYAPEDFPQPDLFIEEGMEIAAGHVKLNILHTPGHTPGSVCLLGNGMLFTGDTLFRGSAGRTDLPGGDTVMLINSLGRIKRLTPETMVFCGHGDESTIGEEKIINPFFRHEAG